MKTIGEMEGGIKVVELSSEELAGLIKSPLAQTPGIKWEADEGRLTLTTIYNGARFAAVARPNRGDDENTFWASFGSFEGSLDEMQIDDPDEDGYRDFYGWVGGFQGDPGYELGLNGLTWLLVYTPE